MKTRVLALAALLATTPLPLPDPVPARGPVALVVLVVVDQMRADYLGRYARQ